MSDVLGPFQVVVADYADAFDELRAVRERVFVQEQGVPVALELDDLDPRSRQVLARDRSGCAIGTARLTPEGRIGRMAVLRDWRGSGVGSALLHALLRIAREEGRDGVALNAQVEAIPFYARHGFVAHGERFMEAGIEHQAMRLRFDRPQAIEDRDAAVAATVAIIDGASRRLWIYSRELDPGLYDHPRVLEALRRFGTAGRGNEVRLLLQDAAAAQRAHAPLLQLAQRLPSVFAIREVEDPVDRSYPSAFLASDAGGCYFRTLGHRFDGEVEFDARARAAQLVNTFDPIWERARLCSEVRALGL